MGCRNSKHALSHDDLEFITEHTGYTEKDVKESYKIFKNNYPEGHLIIEKAIEAAKTSYNNFINIAFLEHIYRVFDQDKNGNIGFKEYLLTNHIALAGTVEEKIRLTFRVLDIDANGVIDVAEMTEMLKILDKNFDIMLQNEDELKRYGEITGNSIAEVKEKFEKLKMIDDMMSPEERANKIFCHKDLQCDGKITEEKFLSAILQNERLLQTFKKADLHGDSFAGINRVDGMASAYIGGVVASYSTYLSQDDLKFLVDHTHYDEPQIEELYKAFRNVYGSNYMILDMEKDKLSEHISRALDPAKRGCINFKEYSLALHAFTAGTMDERIKRVFRIFDINGNKVIDMEELTKIIQSVYSELGHADESSPMTAEERARLIMGFMDSNYDGQIREEDFMRSILQNMALMNKLQRCNNVLDIFYSNLGQARNSSLTAEEWARDLWSKTDLKHLYPEEQFLGLSFLVVDVKNLGPDESEEKIEMLFGCFRLTYLLSAYTTVIALHGFNDLNSLCSLS